ncbi:MAG: YifB family Mg chelatase-like AAA ATPase [Candidatus Aminicenantes bacterium]|nr:YifB family Mg chelatase-like AAA ATPase [Candidatus Aminicenantes bacterium]
MFFRIWSAALQGIEAFPVEVEIDVTQGLPNFIIVGLPDTTIRESEQRIRSALKNCGYEFPRRRIVVNLAPADRRKEGSSFDLPIALGLLAYLNIIPSVALDKKLFLAELALDGRLKPVKGALIVSLLAKKMNLDALVVPTENGQEAALVEELEVYSFESLREVIDFLRQPEAFKPCQIDLKSILDQAMEDGDFSEVKGQFQVKRALEVAAAGAHNVLMIGPPGAGKTMLARRLPSILPPMSWQEILEVTKIYSAAGLLRGRAAICNRPFRAPHHTITDAGLIGGGLIPKPGEISLAHHGVLFLDELPEFRRKVLEDLRQPLEDGQVVISRASMSLTFPCSFMLVAAMNPCSFIFYHAFSGEDCPETEKRRYYSRLSTPLLDRIDIQIEVPAVKISEYLGKVPAESSAQIRGRVIKARERQLQRFRGLPIYANAQMRTKEVRRFCELEEEGERLLEAAMKKFNFSARALERILKVSRTIADLAGEEKIKLSHLAEAIQYRALDRLV